MEVQEEGFEHYPTEDDSVIEMNGPQPVEEPIIVESKEDIEKRIQLLSRINKAEVNFGHKLVGHVPRTDLATLSLEELEAYNTTLRKRISYRNNEQIEMGTLNFGLRAIEGIGTKFAGLRIQGMSDMLMNSEDFVDDFKEQMLDIDVNMNPMTRMTFKMMQTAFTLHTLNVQAQSIEVINLDKPVSDEDIERFSDL